MSYDVLNGKRVKEPFNHINWAHKLLKFPDYNLNQCFFGEHLLKENPEKLVCIVESEKTALIASIFMPECIWLATGGKNGCRWTDKNVFGVLKDKTVVLWPDLGAYNKWQSNAQGLFTMAKISVSDLLEKNASDDERKKGYDIADYLLKFDPKDFEQSKLNRADSNISIEKPLLDEVLVDKNDDSPLTLRKNQIEWDLKELFFSTR